MCVAASHMLRQLRSVSFIGFLPVRPVLVDSSDDRAPPGVGRLPADGGVAWSDGRGSVALFGCAGATAGGAVAWPGGMLVAGGLVSRFRWEGVAGNGEDDGGGAEVLGADVAGPPPVGPPPDGEELVCASAAPASASAKAEVKRIRMFMALCPRRFLRAFNMGNAPARGNVPLIDAARLL